MHFEILGDISEIETFATGAAIRELTPCGKRMDAGDGANARGLLMFD
jgi:hypothetical protein